MARYAFLCLLASQGTRAGGPSPQKKAHANPAHANKRVCVRLSPATDLVFHWETHYNQTHHEHTPRGGGASDCCRPKLHRWPFSVLISQVTFDLSRGLTCLSLE